MTEMLCESASNFNTHETSFDRKFLCSHLALYVPDFNELLSISQYCGIESRIQICSVTKQNKLRGLSPRANYTDLATATCRRNLVPTFVDRGVSHGKRGGSPTVVNLSFLDRCSATRYIKWNQTRSSRYAFQKLPYRNRLCQTSILMIWRGLLSLSEAF
jgi:hypothetical protein